MQRILITGGSGLLGSRLSKDLPNAYSLSGRAELDLRNEKQVIEFINSLKPELVIHCAALANVEACEKDKQLANDINIKGTANLIKACSEFTRKFIYISTDLVFENQVAPEIGFREADLTSTFSHYAHTKLFGESLAFASTIAEVDVLRLSLILDLHPKYGYLTDSVYKLSQGQSLSMYCDEWRTPLLIDDFVRGLDVFIKQDHKERRNIFHVGGLERVSRYDLGLKIAKVWNFDSNQIIKSNIEFHTGLVPRAKDVSLNSSKFWRITEITPSPLEEGLRRIKT